MFTEYGMDFHRIARRCVNEVIHEKLFKAFYQYLDHILLHDFAPREFLKYCNGIVRTMLASDWVSYYGVFISLNILTNSKKL